jgi:hypothetical protein
VKKSFRLIHAAFWTAFIVFSLVGLLAFISGCGSENAPQTSCSGAECDAKANCLKSTSPQCKPAPPPPPPSPTPRIDGGCTLAWDPYPITGALFVVYEGTDPDPFTNHLHLYSTSVNNATCVQIGTATDGLIHYFTVTALVGGVESNAPAPVSRIIDGYN